MAVASAEEVREVGTIRRRRWVIVVVGAVLVLAAGGLATVLTLRHLDHQYGPIYSGPYDGPLTVTSLAGPYGHERFKVAPGETVNFMESLTNFGPTPSRSPRSKLIES